jgi:hypothetical protein
MPPQTHTLKICLLLYFHLSLRLPSGLFPSGFPTKTLHASLISPIRATCLAHLILLDFINRTIVGEENRSLSSTLCSFLHSPVTSSLLGPNFPLLTSYQTNSPVPRQCQMVPNMVGFKGEEFVAPGPTPKLEDTPMSAVRECLFNIFAANIHIGGRCSIRHRGTPHAVVTGATLSLVRSTFGNKFECSLFGTRRETWNRGVTQFRRTQNGIICYCAQHNDCWSFNKEFYSQSIAEHFVYLITALFWAVKQRAAVFITQVSGQPIGPIFRGQGFLTPEDGTDRLSRNVGKK